jgi:glycosyltransferase involved in cell wall biosynthesis
VKLRTSDSPTLLLVHSSADLYGSDVSLLQLVSGLDRTRFQVLVIVPYSGPLVSQLQKVGAEVIVYPDLPVIRRQYLNARGLFHLISSLRSISGLVKLIRKRNVALVQGNTLAVSLVGLAARLAKRPQIWNIREIITQPQVVGSLLATLSSMMSTVVVANSQTTANHYRRSRFATSTPVRVILNGVDETRLRGHSGVSLRSLVGADSQDSVFTLIGRINRWKGHSIFLDAAERLAAEFENVRFLIVGDSFAGQEQLSEAVDHRIQSSDILRKRATRLTHIAEVGSVYKASDVVVVPSTIPESFGLVAAEAMAAGLPVIASRIGALPEIMEHNRTGILVEPGDTASLLTAMKKLNASPSLRAEMGCEGRKRFERCFRVERYVKEFTQLYKELLDNQGAF